MVSNMRYFEGDVRKKDPRGYNVKLDGKKPNGKKITFKFFSKQLFQCILIL